MADIGCLTGINKIEGTR